MSNIEPFGYFKVEPCGWTDCHDDDEGAIPLWDNAAMCAVEKQRDDLLAALIKAADFIQPYNRARDLLDDLDAVISSVKGGA